MQNRRKEDQGYIISLILTFAARWVQLFFAFLGSMIPGQFQDLIPSALVMFFIWSVPICQAAACFVAIRYIQRNPDKQKQGVICLVIALIFFTANSIFSTLLTGMANWDTSHFG